MSRTRNSKFGSWSFFISRGSRGEASSFTVTCCSALPRTTVSFTVLPILYCRTIVANRSSSDGCDASTGVVVYFGDDVADAETRGGRRRRPSPG